jgi:UDP-3-O-acyl-N-acetylglucosamine deacetylase
MDTDNGNVFIHEAARHKLLDVVGDLALIGTKVTINQGIL